MPAALQTPLSEQSSSVAHLGSWYGDASGLAACAGAIACGVTPLGLSAATARQSVDANICSKALTLSSSVRQALPCLAGRSLFNSDLFCFSICKKAKL